MLQVLLLEVQERFQLAELLIPEQTEPVQKHHNLLRHNLPRRNQCCSCHSLRPEHSKMCRNGMTGSDVSSCSMCCRPERCKRCRQVLERYKRRRQVPACSRRCSLVLECSKRRSLVLGCSKYGTSHGAHESCNASAGSSYFGQLRRCWRATMLPTQTGNQDVA